MSISSSAPNNYPPCEPSLAIDRTVQPGTTLGELRAQAIITPLTIIVSGVATHAEDDVMLSTALSGNAQFLVTGDYKLIALKQYQGVALVTAREFLAMLPGLTDPSIA